MDELEPSTIQKPDLAEPSGDVDDLIFHSESDWFVSDR